MEKVISYREYRMKKEKEELESCFDSKAVMDHITGKKENYEAVRKFKEKLEFLRAHSAEIDKIEDEIIEEHKKARH